jgi:HTH-type transcriptional regulator/antitoxin HigA
MTATAVDYARLLSETQPSVVHEERQNELYTQRLEELAAKKHPTRAERKLIELLTLLIEDFESKYHKIENATPVQTITELMAVQGLKQKDLVKAGVFESASVASEILSGKRDLTKEHIRRLSQHFHVSPMAFFE